MHLCECCQYLNHAFVKWCMDGARVEVSHGCALCSHLFILCSHGDNFFNDVGLIFRWLLKERNTQKPKSFAVRFQKLSDEQAKRLF